MVSKFFRNYFRWQSVLICAEWNNIYVLSVVDFTLALYKVVAKTERKERREREKELLQVINVKKGLPGVRKVHWY